jgi:hypothetical protein
MFIDVKSTPKAFKTKTLNLWQSSSGLPKVVRWTLLSIKPTDINYQQADFLTLVFSPEKTTFGKPEEDCQRLRGRYLIFVYF